MFWKVVTIQVKALLAVKLLHLLVFHEVLFLGDRPSSSIAMRDLAYGELLLRTARSLVF